jgi:hypothetical protein
VKRLTASHRRRRYLLGGWCEEIWIMRWRSQRPGLVNALQLFWLIVLILTPVLISQLFYSALE